MAGGFVNVVEFCFFYDNSKVMNVVSNGLIYLFCLNGISCFVFETGKRSARRKNPTAV